MDLNLLEVVKRSTNGDPIKRAAGVLNETESATRGAPDKPLPGLIGGIAAKGATTDGARELLSRVRDALLSRVRDADVFAPESLVGGSGQGDAQQRAPGDVRHIRR
jgi:hypothetical protein